MSFYKHHIAVILMLFVLHNATARANDDLYISSGNVIFTEHYDRRILVESGVVLNGSWVDPESKADVKLSAEEKRA